MKKVFSVFAVLLFMSGSLNAWSAVIQQTSCAEKANFAAAQIVAEYEDASYWEVWFYAYGKCIEKDFGL